MSPIYEILSYSTPNVHAVALGAMAPSGEFRYTAVLHTPGQSLPRSPLTPLSAFDVESALATFVTNVLVSENGRLSRYVADDLKSLRRTLRTFRHTDPTYPVGMRYSRV